jgi:hypothetical protein
LCEPASHNPYLSYQISVSASKQITTQVRTAHHTEICPSNSTIETDLDSQSNQDSKVDRGFSEHPYNEDFENNTHVAPSSAAHGPAARPFCLNKKQKRTYRSWDQRFQELVEFKKSNGHTNVPFKSGQLGNWVSHQRTQYYLSREGKHSRLTSEKREKLESIGLLFRCPPTRILSTLELKN